MGYPAFSRNDILDRLRHLFRLFQTFQIRDLPSERCHCRLFHGEDRQTTFGAVERSGTRIESPYIAHELHAVARQFGRVSAQARIPRGTNRSPHQRSIGRRNDIENGVARRNRLYRPYVRVGNHSHRSRFDRHPYISRYFQEKFRFRKMERFRRRTVRNALQRR